MATTAARLHATIAAAGIPLHGVSLSGNNTATIAYAPQATAQQQQQGEALLAAFDWSEAAHNAYEKQQRGD